MRKLLNTLYITNPDIVLRRDGLTIVAKLEDEKIAQYPIHNFEDIVCFNYTGVSSSLLELCAEKNVAVVFMSRTGKFRGKFYGPVKGNVLLRKEQYRISESEEDRLLYARLFVFAKIFNQVKSIDRVIRDHKSKINVSKLELVKYSLLESKEKAIGCTSYEKLLGIEGDSARNYFSVLGQLILQQKEDFYFNDRNKRPALDRVNAMLNLTYGLIRVKMESALETVGLDPYVGFLHKDRPGRTGLALDMMEELRTLLGDKFVIKLINNKEIRKQDFIEKENGGIFFSEDGFKKYIDLWNKRMFEEIEHPFLEEKIPLGLLPYVQAMLLSRTLRNDLEMYPPFFIN